MSAVLTAHFGATHGVDEEFLELVWADDELVRAEFEAIIAREWPTRRPPAERRATSGQTDPYPRGPLAAGAAQASPGGPRHPGGRRQRRQRSPPPPGRAAAHPQPGPRRGRKVVLRR